LLKENILPEVVAKWKQFKDEESNCPVPEEKVQEEVGDVQSQDRARLF
jgi:hypothetical protein